MFWFKTNGNRSYKILVYFIFPFNIQSINQSFYSSSDTFSVIHIDNKFTIIKLLFFLWFPLCRSETGLVVGLFFPIFFFSAFLRSIFTQSSHPSCGLPSFLQPSCFFISVSDHCGQAISFGSLTILPTTSFSSNFFSFKCYVMQMGVGGCQVFRKKRYEGVSFNVISVTMG